MNLTDQTIHERKVSARFDEHDLHALLVQKVAKESGFVLDPRTTLSHVIISTKDRMGTSGIEYYAEVTLTNALPSSDGQ